MAPPSLNPPSVGQQTPLSNAGSPFGQSQQTNPFMGSGPAGAGSNNASNSPFAAAGFKNPFSNEQGSGGNPFGGGTAGGGVKGLIESNNKLIQAINKLTSIFEKVSQKLGQGGMGGAMGGIGALGAGGMAGGLGGMDPLQAAQMRKLAAGSGSSLPNGNPFFRNTGGTLQDAANGFSPYGGLTGSGGIANEVYQQNDPFRQNFVASHQMNQQAVGNYRTMGAQGQTLEQFQNTLNNETVFDPYGNGGGMNGAQMQQRYEAFQQGQADYARQQALENRSIFQKATDATFGNTRVRNVANFVGNTGANAFNFGANIGSTGTMQGMLSQIPYIGGLLSIPYATLENRINQFAPAESTARLVAQQGGLGQGGNYFATHAAMFDRFKLLGLDPNAALQEALSFQESSGVMTGMDPMNVMGSRLSAFVGAGFTGQTVGSFQRLNRKDRMLSFDPSKVFNYGLSLGLGDQGQMELLGAFEGIQQMIPGMGYRGNASRVLGQIANNTNNGFIGTQGVLQAQRQIQGTAEAGRGLKGIFGGLLETMTMADMLVQSGGDISKAIRNFESGYATDPSALKGALTKRFGKTVTEMGYLAGMTSADYDNIGQGQFAQGTLPGADLGDIVLSKKLVGQQIDRGNDLYKNRLNPANKLLDLNAKLEQTIIDGVSVRVLNNVGKPLTDLAKDMQNMATNLSKIVGYMIKGVDQLAKILEWLTRW